MVKLVMSYETLLCELIDEYALPSLIWDRIKRKIYEDNLYNIVLNDPENFPVLYFWEILSRIIKEEIYSAIEAENTLWNHNHTGIYMEIKESRRLIYLLTTVLCFNRILRHCEMNIRILKHSE